MKKTFVFAVLAAMMLIAVPATAVLMETSQTLPFSFGLSPGNEDLHFDMFCPETICEQGMTGVLKEVVLELDYTIGTDITIENDAALAGNISVALSGFIQAGGGGLGVTGLLSHTTPAVPLAATDGQPGKGLDYHDFGTVSVSGNDDDDLTNPPDDLSYFIGCGEGSVVISIHAEGGWSFAGTSDATLQISNFGASGDATITYYYECVPEPMTLLLMGLGTVALRFGKRR